MAGLSARHGTRNSWMARAARAIQPRTHAGSTDRERTHTQAHVLSPPKRGGTRAPSRCGLRSLPIRHGGALTVSCPVWLHSPGVLLSLTHLLQGYGEAARRAWHPSPSGCAQGTTILHRVCPAARERRVGKGVRGSTCVVTGESLCTFATPRITWPCRRTQQPHGRGGGKWNAHAHGITVAKSDARVAGWLQRRECHKPGAKPTCCSGAINEAIKANTTASQLLPSAGWKKVRGFVIETSSSGHFSRITMMIR